MALAALYAPDLTTTCTIDALPGLSAQLRRVSRATGVDPRTATPATTSPPQAGRIAEFWQLAESVGLPSAAEADCDASVRARDDVAWSMGLVGYSAREIADVLNGHLSRADLDEALSRTMAGEPKSLVAAFLESRWREPVTAATTSASPAQRSTNSLLPDQLETALIALASEHRIQPALVRAVIAVESGGNARAVSPAGAIGLMQLMPRTAAALGVNPWQPLENLRGGIAYLAGLLRAYGDDIRLALIAYNAGPSHADLVRSGRAVAYRETRKYLEAILAKYPVP
jgi:soluble lytic murein transglycosylase-like protein